MANDGLVKELTSFVEKQKEITEKFGNLEAFVTAVETRVDMVENGLKNVEFLLNDQRSQYNSIINRISQLENRLTQDYLAEWCNFLFFCTTPVESIKIL